VGWAVLLLLVVSLSFGRAQTLQLGAVLPLTGGYAEVGRAQREALELAKGEFTGRGVGLELHLLDSRSDPARAGAQAAELAAAGVHALVCCATPEAAEAVRPVAARGVPTLALTDAPSQDDWLFSLVPGDGARLRATVSNAGAWGRLGLMAPDTELGDAARRALRVPIGAARYPADARVLTPEALWVATREPDAVLVWGENAVTAVHALRERGFTGEVVIDAAQLGALGPLSRAKLSGSLALVSPALLGYTLPEGHPSAEAVTRYLRSAALADASDPTPEGAYAWDAAGLLLRALEQALAYGLLLDDPATVRGALHETLIGLPPVAGASGVFDFRDGAQGDAQAASWVLARFEGGRFVPAPLDPP